MGIESIVRPFETPRISPAATPSSATPESERNVVIICGENGSAKTFNGNWSLTITRYQIKKPKEKQRTEAEA